MSNLLLFEVILQCLLKLIKAFRKFSLQDNIFVFRLFLRFLGINKFWIFLKKDNLTTIRTAQEIRK